MSVMWAEDASEFWGLNLQSTIPHLEIKTRDIFLISKNINANHQSGPYDRMDWLQVQGAGWNSDLKKIAIF